MLLIPLQAVRTNRHTGKVFDVTVDAQITKDTVHIYGGPTGFESFMFDKDRARKKHEMIRDGWYACIGTKGKWDKLYIPPESCIELWRFIDEQLEILP